MWQEIAIIGVAIAVISYVGYKIYRLFIRPKRDNPCEGCCGCSLKNQRPVGKDKK